MIAGGNRGKRFAGTLQRLLLPFRYLGSINAAAYKILDL
jgi:hypothetical protein